MQNHQEMISKFRENVKRFEKNPDIANISFMAIDAFQDISQSKKLTEESLNKIIHAMISHNIGAMEVGMALIGELVEQYPQINDVIRTLANSKSSHVRRVAITILYDDRFSYELALELIKKAINDKSTKVREFAVDRAFVRALNPLLPDLIERAKIEENETVLYNLKYAISFMEQQV